MSALSDFQRAARALLREADSRCCPGHAVLYDSHGKVVVQIVVPGGDDAPSRGPGLADPPPAPAGWSFTGAGQAVYDGAVLRGVAGRKLDVLRVLVEADGPVTTERLRAAWGGTVVEESSVRWQVGELKKSLKAEFPDFEGDLIEASGHGYRLLLQ